MPLKLLPLVLAGVAVSRAAACVRLSTAGSTAAKTGGWSREGGDFWDLKVDA